MKEDNHLIERARQGCIDAFHEIVLRTSSQVFQVCYQILRDKQSADDAVQETYIKAFTRLQQFTGQSQFKTWLQSIAVRASIDIARKQKRLHEDEYDWETPAPSVLEPPNAVNGASVGREISRSLERLSFETRVAFVLRHYHGYSIEAISEITGVPPNTVKNRIFRAVAQLRESLAHVWCEQRQSNS